MIQDVVLEEKVKVLCEKLNISLSFNNVKNNNPSNNLPYHNWYHICCMVEKVIEGANYHNLPYRSIRHLAVAALYHDWNHSGGKFADSVNISRALSQVSAIAHDAGIDRDEIETIIRITEYPYISDPICIEQKIIRDADLMQSFRDDTWKEMLITGLRQEISVKLGKELNVRDFCIAQIQFLKQIVPFSEWGNTIMNIHGKLNQAISHFQNELDIM